MWTQGDSDRPALPGGDQSDTAAAAGPFTMPAPPLPELVRPDTEYTNSPGAARHLARYNARRAAVKPSVWSVVVWMPLITVCLTAAGLPALPLVCGVVAGTLYIPYAIYRLYLRHFEVALGDAVPATTWRVRFGADGITLTDHDSYSRFGRDRIRSLSVAEQVAVLRFDGMRLALPAPLFPAPLVERWQRAAQDLTSLDALPPLPTVPSPDVVVTADHDTARLLAVAHLSEPWRRAKARANVVLLALLVVGAAVVAGRNAGLLGAAVPVVAGGLYALFVWYFARNPTESVLRKFRHAAVPGATLSARFGSDAVLVATTSYLVRLPYTALGAIEIRGPVATVGYSGVPIMLPSGLFPPHLRGGLGERGVRITVR
ncbi:hypothetical protein ACFWM1_00730 [Nocardia sp. NPDC058379]|uniref:hypothetical protein n=1 Tax=unclassified Nocardia TaxID=2637762 RepID=UPI00364C1DAF